jgi:hypothetical protein
MTTVLAAFDAKDGGPFWIALISVSIVTTGNRYVSNVVATGSRNVHTGRSEHKNECEEGQTTGDVEAEKQVSSWGKHYGIAFKDKGMLKCEL